MHIGTTWQDYPSPEDVAVIVYFKGCTHNCKGCHSPGLQTFHDDYLVSLNEILHYLSVNKTQKLVLSGGDPLAPVNVQYSKYLLEYMPVYVDTCIYTGYDLNYIKHHYIKHFKFIKSGTYKEELAQVSGKNSKKITFASRNQVLYSKDLTQISDKGVYHFTKE